MLRLMSVSLELEYPSQEDCHEFESSLSFIARLSRKNEEEGVINVNKYDEDKDIV